MVKYHYRSTGGLIKKLIDYAKSSAPLRKDLDSLCRFIRYFYAFTALEDLEDRSIEVLYGIACFQWELLQIRRPEEIKCRVFNPTLKKDGFESTHTIIAVLVQDSPFLIDSIRMEINRLGLTAHLMINMGGVVVKRDAGHHLVDIKRHTKDPAKGGIVEDPFYFEVDRQTDPKEIAAIQAGIESVLNDVHLAVSDWRAMQEAMCSAIEGITGGIGEITEAEAHESQAFLEWLLADNFTFLGVRDYEMVGEGEALALRLIPDSGLGVLRDESGSKRYRLLSDLPDQARALFLSKTQLLMISKTNTRATIHRPSYTDYIGVKQFNDKGELCGERRFIGLYTSTAYSSSPLAIPFLRHKVQYLLKKSGLPARSHASKDLLHILSNLPRDDLFQATKKELYELSMGILNMQERRRIRLFLREDAYGRYISCLVFVPKDNFNTQLLRAIESIFNSAFQALEITYTTLFSASILARIHFVVRLDSAHLLDYDIDALEAEIVKAGKSWGDGFKEQAIAHFGEEKGNQIYKKYKMAFPTSYREAFDGHQAVHDILRIEKLKTPGQLEMTVYRPPGAGSAVISLKLYQLGSTVPLSDALPILENMGLRVIGEHPHELTLASGETVWINDFEMEMLQADISELKKIHKIFQEAFSAVWQGHAENDEFNRLVLEANFSWREIAVFRAYTKYLHQVGFRFSLQYVALSFLHNVSVARILLKLFHCYFDPENRCTGERIAALENDFLTALDTVNSLDEDRIFRRFLDVLKATQRTNYYQRDDHNQLKPYIALKFSPVEIPELPLPLPLYEIFVYSPRFEGIHLRMAKIARGGIRWSDRQEDFRTEVLGLMKAQQVKNSVIVPAGAKGGFVLKQRMLKATREEFLQEGIACYKNFIHGLLDITDNLVNNKIKRPKQVYCRDGEDPYLVVAADKGTATFSDIANQIAVAKEFWLGDAFASGGCTGYDHKKMGITARGAWVSAERQFQELGIDVDQAPIQVVGIGDMAGDVFGNGVLLSQRLKLVAAFNHLHIFIDPNPDAGISFQERKRLFALPRSTWEDYDSALISKGGGVFKRSAKSIRLTPEIKQLLDVNKDSMPPNELIRAILRAPVDMIWNGGIGTFAKASTETDEDCGDRTNNAIRVDAKQLRTKVICEGGNLGFTQLARIEFELNGGKVNTDFIDNSAGVDCSDHEVNIKILLNQIQVSGQLDEPERNDLLTRMTDEVAELVLQNNYHQNQVLSLAAYSSLGHLGMYSRYMDVLEKNERLNRALEFLPTTDQIMDRKSEDLGLTKPELSVLLAYTKNLLKEDLTGSELLSAPHVKEYVRNAFPTPLIQRYMKAMDTHRLHDDIVATQLSNRVVSDMGITFIYCMQDETGATLESILRAYLVAHDIFDMASIFADIESLDYKVEAEQQYRMMLDIIRLVRRATRWFLRNRRDEVIDIKPTIRTFLPHVDALRKRLPKLLFGTDKADYEQRIEDMINAGVMPDIAQRMAATDNIYHALNIIEASNSQDYDVFDVAKTYFMLVDRLNLFWFRGLIDTYPSENHWSILAKAAYKGDLDWVQRELTLSVLTFQTTARSFKGRITEWMEKHASLIERWEEVVTRLKAADARDFAMLSVAIRELSDITKVI